MHSHILRWSLFWAPPVVGSLWEVILAGRRVFQCGGELGACWFTVMLWSSLSSFVNLPSCIHFESWHWNFQAFVSYLSPFISDSCCFLDFRIIVGSICSCAILLDWPFLSSRKGSDDILFCFRAFLPAQYWTQGLMGGPYRQVISSAFFFFSLSLVHWVA